MKVYEEICETEGYTTIRIHKGTIKLMEKYNSIFWDIDDLEKYRVFKWSWSNEKTIIKFINMILHFVLRKYLTDDEFEKLKEELEYYSRLLE